MKFFSSDKRLEEIFFQNHPPPPPHPPQELNGRPLRGAFSKGAIAKARMFTHVVEARVMGDPLGY